MLDVYSKWKTTFLSPTTDLLWHWASYLSHQTVESLLNANSITFTLITAIGEVKFMKCCEIPVCVAKV